MEENVEQCQALLQALWVSAATNFQPGRSPSWYLLAELLLLKLLTIN